MEFRVLGPLEVRTADGAAIPLTGPKRRALLALFVLNAGDVISSSRLADELWQGAPPKSAATTLQTFVYQLRRRYGIEELITTPSGYVLDVAPDRVDARWFEQAVSLALVGATDEPRRAQRALAGALDMWRGPAYAEFTSEAWAWSEAARLEQLRLEVVEAWAATAIGSGETAGLASELETWTRRNPLREPLWTLRLVALVEAGRTAEALRVGNDLRRILGEELGIDPSARFIAVETAVLRGEALPPWTELAAFVHAAVDARPEAQPPIITSRPTRRRASGAPSRRDAVHSSPATDRFVGRAPELRALEDALEDASNGLPQVVLIVGDAGIGKSRMLDEFTPRAIACGAQLLFGVCQEDGIPYLPVASALAPLVADSNPFAPEQLATTGGADDDGARLALFLGTTRALLASAAERVTMLVIEDVHWADDATVGLLRHLVSVGSDAAARDRARLVIVLTSRPPEAGAVIESFVRRATRGPRTRFIDMRALTAAEIRELATDWLDQRPSTATVDVLLEATGGNPLILRSILGRLRGLGGAVSASALSDLLGPTDLDRELWLRTEDVGEACMEMLVHAATLGDGAPLAWLDAVADISTDARDDLIAEASEHHVLFADDERYWFEHPQLRQLVYYSASGDERAAGHLAVADRLAPLGADVVIVAHHITRAGSLVDASRVLVVCGAAADHSATVGAWRDASTYASAALQAGSELDLSVDAMGELELRAGRAAFLARDRDAAIAHLTVAADLARSCGDLGTWGRAVVRLARESLEDRELRSSTARSLAALDEFIAAAGEDERALRAEAHAVQAELDGGRGDLATGRRHVAIAEDLALRVDDDEVRTKVTFARGLLHLFAVELDEARDSFARAGALATGLADPNPRIWCLTRSGMVAYLAAALPDAETVLDEALAAAHDADNVADYSMAAALAAATAAAQGHFARVEDDCARARRAYLAAEFWFTPGLVFPTLAATRAHRGDGAGAHAALDDWDAVQERRSRRYRPLVDAMVGDTDAAAKTLEAAPFRLFTGAGEPDLYLSGAIAAQAELGALLGLPGLVTPPLEALIQLYERGLRFTLGWPAFVPRVIARGLAATGREAEAAVWFGRALETARTGHAEAEIARTALDHGRVLHDRNELTEADRLLTLAGHHYSAMSVHPSLPGSDLLRPVDANVATLGTSATRVVLVTDLVGSTTLNAALGDRDYLPLLREHDAIVRHELARTDGVQFKHTGDGIAAWFYSINNALDCADALCRQFQTPWAGAGNQPLGVKIALSAGEPALVDGDLLGLSVTLAFRVLDHATPHEVLVTSDVAGLARGLPWAFAARGRHELKGMGAPVDLYAVTGATRQ